MLVTPFSRSNKYKSLNAIRCRSPPKIYIFYLHTTTLCPSLAHGFFPIITLRESSYIIYCFRSFFDTSWFPIDYNVFNIDSVVGDNDLFLLYSPGFSLNCFNNYFFFYKNFLCLFSISIFFITSPFLSDEFLSSATLCNVNFYGLFDGLFLLYCFKVGEHSYTLFVDVCILFQVLFPILNT